MDVESQVQGTERTVERDLTLQVVPLEPTSAPPSWRPEGTDFAFLAVSCQPHLADTRGRRFGDRELA